MRQNHHLLGKVAVRLNSNLPDQLGLASHHDGRVPLVVHLRECGSRIFRLSEEKNLNLTS